MNVCENALAGMRAYLIEGFGEAAGANSIGHAKRGHVCRFGDRVGWVKKEKHHHHASRTSRIWRMRRKNSDCPELSRTSARELLMREICGVGQATWTRQHSTNSSQRYVVHWQLFRPPFDAEDWLTWYGFEWQLQRCHGERQLSFIGEAVWW